MSPKTMSDPSLRRRESLGGRRGEHDMSFPINKPPDLHAQALIELAVPTRTRQSGGLGRVRTLRV